MSWKIPKGDTALQQAAVQAHLDALGITVGEDRRLDEAALRRLPGGPDALRAVAGDDGKLDLAALAKLLGDRPRADAKTAPSAALGAARLAADGLVAALEAAPTPLDGASASRLARRARHAVDALQAVAALPGPALLAAGAEPIDALAKADQALVRSATALLRRVSQERARRAERLPELVAQLSGPQAEAARVELDEAARLARELGDLRPILDAALSAADALGERRIEETLHLNLQAQLERPEAVSAPAATLALALQRTERSLGAQLDDAALSVALRSLPEDDARTSPAARAAVRAAALVGVDVLRALPTPTARAAAIEAASADTSPARPAIEAALSRPEDAAALIEAFAGVPGIAALLAEWSGVSEGYSIRRHTEMVLARYVEQRPHFGLDRLRLPPDVDLDRTLTAMFVLHDIGKPAAVEAGDKNAQHEHTVPILEHVLADLGFSESERRIAVALVDNDLLADLVKQDARPPEKPITPAEAETRLAKIAEDAGLAPATAFQLQALMFTVDASSYPFLRERVFAGEEGERLRPKSSPSYEALERAVGLA